MNTTRTKRQIRSMLKVDFRRMFRTPFFYLIAGISLVMPILILVMTTMMDGMVSVNPQTGAETVIEGFDNVWQIIGSVSTAQTDAAAGMDMSITAMCNVNMLYFLIAIPVCVFVAGDFRSGYAKNLFTVRSGRTDYVVSKTVVCTLAAMLMLLAFFIGSVIGGKIAGLPFETVGFGGVNLVFCLLCKLALAAVFVPIYLVMSVCAKQRLWLSILLSMMTGMFLFMMIPMLSPLNATAAQLGLCLAGGVLLSIGLGLVSRTILRKRSIL